MVACLVVPLPEVLSLKFNNFNFNFNCCCKQWLPSTVAAAIEVVSPAVNVAISGTRAAVLLPNNKLALSPVKIRERQWWSYKVLVLLRFLSMEVAAKTTQQQSFGQ